VTQNESRGIVVLTAQTQQIISRELRQIESAAVHVIEKLSTGDVKETRRKTQQLPQLRARAKAWPVSGAAKSLTTINTAPNAPHYSELLVLAFGAVRAAAPAGPALFAIALPLLSSPTVGRSPTSLAPGGNGFLNEPSLSVSAPPPGAADVRYPERAADQPGRLAYLDDGNDRAIGPGGEDLLKSFGRGIAALHR
jgi:hypothetical protein